MLRPGEVVETFLMQPFGISMTLCGKGKVLDNNKIHMSCVMKILLDTGYFILLPVWMVMFSRSQVKLSIYMSI